MKLEMLAELLGETIVIAANTASAMQANRLLSQTEALNIVTSMQKIAQVLDDDAGGSLPAGLASELQARAYTILADNDYQQRRT